MALVFKTSLNLEEFKDTLQRRAYSKGIEIAFKDNKIIIQNCIIRMQFIDYHVPFIARTSNVNNMTLIKGHISLPIFHYISMLVVFTIFACIVLLNMENAFKIYIPFIFLLIVAISMIGILRFILNSSYSNFPIHNKEVLELLNSIVNDFPASQTEV